MDEGQRAREVAAILLHIGAVSIRARQPFRYRSGILSPIYTDNRLLCSYPRERSRIADLFVSLITEKQLKPDVLAGVATAGIPHAAWVADRLDLPMVYVRADAKDHGRGRRIEGTLTPQRDDHFNSGNTTVDPLKRPNVVVIEDHVTTGGGLLNAVGTLREEHATVSHCLAIYNYELSDTPVAFKSHSVELHALCSFGQLLKTARELGYISAEEERIVLDWHREPTSWAEKHGLLVSA